MPAIEYWKRGQPPIGQERSQTTTALAAIDDHRALLVHRGATNNNLYVHLYDGRQEARWTIGGAIVGLTKTRPAVAIFGGRAHVFHLGDSSDDIWWARSPAIDSSPTWWRQGWVETRTSLSSALAPTVYVDRARNRIILIGGDKTTPAWAPIHTARRLWWATIDAGDVVKHRGTITEAGGSIPHASLAELDGELNLLLANQSVNSGLSVPDPIVWRYMLRNDAWVGVNWGNDFWSSSLDGLAKGSLGVATLRGTMHVVRTRDDHTVEWLYRTPNGLSQAWPLPGAKGQDQPALVAVGNRLLAVINHPRHAPTLGPYVDFDDRLVHYEYLEPRPEPLSVGAGRTPFRPR